MALDNQTFANLERDISDTGEAVNEKKVINPRYGDPFKSLPLVAEEAEQKADEVVAKGFYLGFANEAAMRAYTPSFAETRAKLDDTKQVFRWERTSAEGATPITGIWHNTGLSELDQAKEFAVQNLSEKTQQIGTIELVSSSPIVLVGQGVNASSQIVSDSRYTAILIPVRENIDITLWNSSNAVSAGSGAGFSFHNAYPISEANRLAAVNSHTTKDSADTFIHTRTPANAKFLVVNKAITSLNFDVSWKIQVGYGLDKSQAFKASSTHIDSKNTLEFKTLNVENLYSSAKNVISAKYVSLQNNTLQDAAAKPNWKVAIIPVDAGVTYKLKLANDITRIKPSFLIATHTTVFNTPVTIANLTSLGDNWYSCVAPIDATYLVLNIDLDVDYPVSIVNSLIVQKVKNASKTAVTSIAGIPIADPVAQANMLVAKVASEVNLYTALTMLKDAYYISVSNNTLQANASGKVAVVPITAGKTYKITHSEQSAAIHKFRFMTDSTLSANKETLAAESEVIVSNTERHLKAPAGSNFLIATAYLVNTSYNFDISTSLSVVDISMLQPTQIEISQLNNMSISDVLARQKISVLEQTSANGASNLTGKKWVVIGDSITHKNDRSHYNYHYYLAQNVGGMTVYNYGISGTGFFNRHDVASKITQTDVDLITIFLGTNDYGNQTAENQKQLGVFGDTGTSTISGCINTLILGLLSKFPLIPIAIFTPLPRAGNYGLNAPDNAYGYNIKDLVDLLHQYAIHYSLPIFDLYSKSNLYPWLEASNEYYFKPFEGSSYGSVADGLHPNDAGHQVIARKLRTFLESI